MKRLVKACLIVGLVVLLLPEGSPATNGMNMIGYNVRSSGLGGADVALDQDCTGATCNPASIGGLTPHSFSAGLSFLLPRVGLKNTAFGPNDAESDDNVYPLPYTAYSRRLDPESPWTLGFVIYGQGGMGVDFEGVRTLAGTEDDLTANIQFARVSPTVSYRVNDRFAVGVTVMLGYARTNFKLFPDTYSPGMDGLPGTMDDVVGMRIDGLSSVGYAARAGFHYRVNERLNLAFTYTTETALDFDDGDLTMNLGIAKVTYDARMKNFTWPREAEAGFAFRATPKLTVAGDVKWINWSSAIEVVTVRGKNPDMPVPLAEPEIRFAMNWNDQWVFALGLEYALNPAHTLRAGYNYGKSPVPDRYALPLFPATVEHHLTVGYAYTSGQWRFDAAFEHSLKHGQKNTNMNPLENPFGPDAEVLANNGDVLHLALTYWF